MDGEFSLDSSGPEPDWFTETPDPFSESHDLDHDPDSPQGSPSAPAVDTDHPESNDEDSGIAEYVPPARVGASRFDQRHLIRLYQMGLIYEPPYELGPMPSYPFHPGIDADLIRWNVVDGVTFTLTPEAADLFAGVDHWQWAVAGVVLLYDERRRITVDIPDEMLNYGVQYAIRDIPRINFMVTVLDEVVTVLILNEGHLSINAFPAGDDPVVTVARLVKNILDPTGIWEPYPLKSEASASLGLLKEAAGARLDPDGPDSLELEDMVNEAAAEDKSNYDLREDIRKAEDDALKKVSAEADRVERALSEAGLSAKSTRTISELVKVHNSANAQVVAYWRTPTRKVSLDGCAMGISFFDKDESQRGIVVSKPHRASDGSVWITYTPGTEEAYIDGIRGLYSMLVAQIESEK